MWCDRFVMCEEHTTYACFSTPFSLSILPSLLWLSSHLIFLAIFFLSSFFFIDVYHLPSVFAVFTKKTDPLSYFSLVISSYHSFSLYKLGDFCCCFGIGTFFFLVYVLVCFFHPEINHCCGHCFSMFSSNMYTNDYWISSHDLFTMSDYLCMFHSISSPSSPPLLWSSLWLMLSLISFCHPHICVLFYIRAGLQF